MTHLRSPPESWMVHLASWVLKASHEKVKITVKATPAEGTDPKIFLTSRSNRIPRVSCVSTWLELLRSGTALP